jgi:aminotransferase EvaB
VIPINDLTRGIAQSDEAIQAISRVLKSGYWIHGPEHAAFEQEFAEFLNVDHVLGVASGTDALEIALRAVGCKRGSKVITVANAGGYTSIAAASIGCELIYCDIDSERLLMDPLALQPLLTSEISAVVVTHLYGNVAPISEIKLMCQQYEIAVIEDCAQATGGFEKNQRVGTIGDLGTFSFYPTKNLGAVGDGGAIATNNPQLATTILKLRQYGWNSKYDIQLSGGKNSRLDELQAAVLRIGLRSLDERNQIRRNIVATYEAALFGSDCKVVTSSNTGNVSHLAVILLPVWFNRDGFIKSFEAIGISTQVHYPILDHNQMVQFAVKDIPPLNNTEALNARIVTIPLFSELRPSEIEKISNGLSQAFKS